MALEFEGLRVDWVPTTEGAELTVERQPGADPSPALMLRFLAHPHERRLSMAIAFPPTDRWIDVSTQPGLLTKVLVGDVSPARAVPRAAYAVVGAWVCELAGRALAWHPAMPQRSSLDAIIGGAAFPMLGAAYERRAGPLAEVPMWAAPVLRRPTAREAALAGFGPKATRPVISALASSLIGPAPREGAGRWSRPKANVTALALGLMGESVLEPDQLARVLKCARPGPVPSSEQIAAGRKVARRLGPRRAERVLTDAGESEEGLNVLAQTVEMYAQVGDQLPNRQASRLLALHCQCRAFMPLDPNPGRQAAERPRRAASRPLPAPRQARPLANEAPPAPAPAPSIVLAPTIALAPPIVLAPTTPTAPTAPTSASATATVARTRETWDRALLPPPVQAQVTTTTLQFPADIRDLDGADLGDLRIVLPRTTAELSSWGRLLCNCLASYGGAAVAGLSWLVGVEAFGQLSYCMELSPDRSVRQFLARQNRRVPRGHARRVLGYLEERGVVDTATLVNPDWY